MKKYQEEAGNTQCPIEREILTSVITDLGRSLYSYRPSATFKLLNWSKKNEIYFVQGLQKEEKEKRLLK